MKYYYILLPPLLLRRQSPVIHILRHEWGKPYNKKGTNELQLGLNDGFTYISHRYYYIYPPTKFYSFIYIHVTVRTSLCGNAILPSILPSYILPWQFFPRDSSCRVHAFQNITIPLSAHTHIWGNNREMFIRHPQFFHTTQSFSILSSDSLERLFPLCKKNLRVFFFLLRAGKAV